MKQKHLYSLLDETFTTVRVQFTQAYEDLVGGAQVDLRQTYDGRLQARNKTPITEVKSKTPITEVKSKSYTYKVPRHWGVREGDVLVVSNHSELKLVIVLGVDANPVLDLDADFTYKWAIQKVDITEYSMLTQREEAFKEQMVSVERERQREELVASFRNTLPEGSEARKLFESTAASLKAPAPQQPPYGWTSPSGEGNHSDAGDR